MKLNSGIKWIEYRKSGDKPHNIPTNPNIIYKSNGWISWSNFLGTEYLPFEEARKYIRNLGFKNIDEYRKYSKSEDKHNNIPANAYSVYQDKGWKNWKDFLGTEREYLPFIEAREFVRKLKITSIARWKEYVKSANKADNIPSSPHSFYKSKGWVNWGDFLGTGFINNKDRIYLPYIEARKFVRKLKITSIVRWNEYVKSGDKPDDIPASALNIYRNKGWVSWADFLGTNRIANQDIYYKSFEEAREFC